MKPNKDSSPRHSGYVGLIGRTNVGKSTFLNAILQTKVAIVSDRPQTTRKRILGIKTTEKGQAIFFDSPGVHKPHFMLNQRMMKEVNEALLDSDLILYFVDIGEQRQDEFIVSLLNSVKKPVFLVINKIDKFKHSRILESIQFYKDTYPWKEIIPVSSIRGDNLDQIEEQIFRYLPEGEDFYPEGELTLRSESFYVSEVIREKLLSCIREELPYITTVRVLQVERKECVVVIQAEIVVETHSQKKIVVGKQGRLVKEVGQKSRLELEEYFKQKVFIDLFVKTVPNWRNSESVIRDIFA